MSKSACRFISTVAVIVLLAGQLLSTSGLTANIRLAETLPTRLLPNGTSYATYYGSNVNGQNYSRWAAPVKSYLTQTDSQTLMRVQGDASSGVLVEYYDLFYNLKSTLIVAKELPIFGGFYETASNYYIISGQENLSQSASVEVVRVTKYDKSWNKISTASLKDCNTFRPFDAGSLRVTESGSYLIIRTCHTMYTSPDGYHHQANMTFQVNTAADPMTITDKQYSVSNISTGYVSHSFNQFVELENNKIVAVDHGDAYPRSIVLVKYSRDVSTGLFNSSCTGTNIITIPGTIGDNTTGATVGAFEIASSNYLIAGNSVVQDDSNTSRTTRNIFVASVSKSTSAVTIHWITDFSEGAASTTTPHMVKITTDSYMLLWSQGDVVYYTRIDGSGQMTGSILSLPGQLSDCAPIVVSDKIVWYTWENATTKFYEIDVEEEPIVDDSKTNIYYRTHVQDVGWQSYKVNGATSGTSGRSLRLEGINIKVTGDANLGVQYTTHVQDYGWLPWSANDEMSGTQGESKRLEAIKIQLTGANKDLYDIYYRVHAQDFGWLDWAANGNAAGTAGFSKRLEAIQIVIVDKGAAAPGSTARSYVANGGTDQVTGANESNVAYQTHIQDVGWQGVRYNRQMSGTDGRSLRLEGIKIRLTNRQYSGGIRYATHIQNIGWQEYKADGELSGTSGQSLRLEAIVIELTGEMANHYDVYYRVHIQDFGWLGWAKNGEESGSQGQSKRLEGIEIVLVEKGGAAPGPVDNRFIK